MGRLITIQQIPTGIDSVAQCKKQVTYMKSHHPSLIMSAILIF